MKIVTIPEFGYPNDVQRLQRILRDHLIELTLMECEALWQEHSDNWCASWLILSGSDAEVWEELRKHITEDHKGIKT